MRKLPASSICFFRDLPLIDNKSSQSIQPSLSVFVGDRNLAESGLRTIPSRPDSLSLSRKLENVNKQGPRYLPFALEGWVNRIRYERKTYPAFLARYLFSSRLPLYLPELLGNEISTILGCHPPPFLQRLACPQNRKSELC